MLFNKINVENKKLYLNLISQTNFSENQVINSKLLYIQCYLNQIRKTKQKLNTKMHRDQKFAYLWT